MRVGTRFVGARILAPGCMSAMYCAMPFCRTPQLSHAEKVPLSGRIGLSSESVADPSRACMCRHFWLVRLNY